MRAMRIGHFLKNQLLNYALPPLCLKCQNFVNESGTLCASCWSGLSFISPPACFQCGVPFPGLTEGEGLQCGSCLENPPPYKAMRAPLFYTKEAGDLILSLKYGDQTEIVPLLGRWMSHSLEDIISQIDLILPVPLHKKRLRWRQYNQASLLAEEISRLRKIPLRQEGLKRLRPTACQGQMTVSERHKNVKEAFQVPEKEKIFIKGAHVLLVDDVLTSGATVHACVHALQKAGAKNVSVSVACYVESV